MNEKLRKLQLAELEILKVFIKVCEENGLKYYLIGGSLLGAVRHKGFIPWDDDIDIGMPRDDYDKFEKIINNFLPNNMKYINFKYLDEPTIYYARMESEEIEINDNSAMIKRKRNAWIDIHPFDGMPNNIIGEKLHHLHVLFQRMLIQYSKYSVIVNQELKNRPLIEKILIKLGKIINFEKILNTKKCLMKFDKILKKYKYTESKKVANFIGANKYKEIFPKELFENTSEYEFEGIKVIAPKEYDKILSHLYGDYMKLPPEEERNKHIIDLD